MIFEDKTILITGGTGSLGKTFVKRVLTGEQGTPKKVIVFSRDEAKQHKMRVEYLNRRITTDETIFNNFKNALEFRIGDVRNYPDIVSAVRDADIIVNAAALKQVPTCEYFPYQAVLTNCKGVYNLIRAIEESDYHSEVVVGVSTDKACKPVNVMGMSKAIQERLFISANILSKKTRFVCVRYGNVLASRGSVIPLFHDQILSGGPVTITNGKMTRFLLPLNKAVDTVFSAIQTAKAGETYIPRISSATMQNIAKTLIDNRQIEIKVIGTRPGEKQHEIMVSEEEISRTIARGDYYVIGPMLPELFNNEKNTALTKEYSSADNPLDLTGTCELLRKYRLMVEDANQDELLR